MKHLALLTLCLSLAACNSLFPYKGQSLDDLNRMVQTPEKYQGNIVSFAGEIRGIIEDIRQVKLVLKIDTPLYYYATGQDPLSYQFLLVTFRKEQPQPTGLSVGDPLKILAKIDRAETRTNKLGNSVCVLLLDAIALSDRPRKKDFFHTAAPDKQLYDSWKAGRLFFKETPPQIVAAFPPAPVQQAAKPDAPQTPTTPLAPAEVSTPADDEKRGIVFDPEESPLVFEE